MLESMQYISVFTHYLPLIYSSFLILLFNTLISSYSNKKYGKAAVGAMKLGIFILFFFCHAGGILWASMFVLRFEWTQSVYTIVEHQAQQTLRLPYEIIGDVMM